MLNELFSEKTIESKLINLKKKKSLVKNKLECEKSKQWKGNLECVKFVGEMYIYNCAHYYNLLYKHPKVIYVCVCLIALL